MATTPNLQLPYPVGTDAPAGDVQIQALAEALDSAVWCQTTGVATSGIGAAWTTIPQTITRQVGGFTVTGSGALRVPIPGVYLICGWVRGTVDGWTNGYLAVTGTNNGSMTWTPSKAHLMAASSIDLLATTTDVQMQVQFAGDGSNSATGGAIQNSKLSLIRLGPAPTAALRDVEEVAP